MYKTLNPTTTVIGQSTATTLAHSVNGNGVEIVTWELVYPRYIHSELMTHRAFSRNAASSRATPTKTLIEEVRANPVYFDEVRLNRRGMVGGELASPEAEKQFRDLWHQGAAYAASLARQMADLGIAKQTVNRILEPFLPIRVIVTATDVENFFRLRLAPDAQPEIQSLAKAMRESMEESEPQQTLTHLPYGDRFNEATFGHQIVRCLAACARVSVMRGDGKETALEDDIALVKRLRASGNMTPFEHVAFEGAPRHANLRGWASLRWFIEHDARTPFEYLNEVLYGEE